MKIQLYVVTAPSAKHGGGYFGAGFSPREAVEALLNSCQPFETPFYLNDEKTQTCPDPKDKSEVGDYILQLLNQLQIRENQLEIVRKHGLMVRLPEGCTDYDVGFDGSISNQGGVGEAVRVKYDAENESWIIQELG